jgi:sulfite reductase beta subunit-like hemoprotein
VEFHFFGGELSSDDLRRLAALARQHAGGQLRVTGNQSLALPPTDTAAQQALVQAAGANSAGPEAFRICPGSHDCRMGLAPTRDLSRQLLTKIGPAAKGMTLAFSGCPNSCSQPQLADFGISATKRLKEGTTPWRFTLYRRSGVDLGEAVGQDLTWEELTDSLCKLTKIESRPNQLTKENLP